LTTFEKHARLTISNDWPTTVIRRGVMGDKGGKKDKEKGQKQNAEKEKRKERNKFDKQPKRKP